MMGTAGALPQTAFAAASIADSGSGARGEGGLGVGVPMGATVICGSARTRTSSFLDGSRVVNRQQPAVDGRLRRLRECVLGVARLQHRRAGRAESALWKGDFAARRAAAPRSGAGRATARMSAAFAPENAAMQSK